MIDISIYIAVTILVFGSVLGIIHFFSGYDLKQQHASIKGRKYRKEHGGFVFEEYVAKTSLIKPKQWGKRKNSGFNPKTYKRNIKFKDHLECDTYLLPKRGL